MSASPQLNESLDILPLTIELLSLISAVQSARLVFINEDCLQRYCNLPSKLSFDKRLRDLFFNSYAAFCVAIGLSQSEQVYRAICSAEITDDMCNMAPDELKKTYVFDAWMGQGRGGIRKLRTLSAVSR